MREEFNGLIRGAGRARRRFLSTVAQKNFWLWQESRLSGAAISLSKRSAHRLSGATFEMCKN